MTTPNPIPDALDLVDALVPPRSDDGWSSLSRVIFHRRIRTTNFSVPDNTVTPVEFGSLSVRNDSGDLRYDTGLNAYLVDVPGWYRVTAQIRFDTNATGRRVIQVRIDGSPLASLSVPPSGAQVDLNVSWTGVLDVDQALDIAAFQNSGGPLNLIDPPNRLWVALERLVAL